MIRRAGFETKQAMVLSSLRTAILEGKLAPGARLLLGEIASRLGVSPIPVREALGALSAEGLVEIRPHVGAVVAGFEEGAAIEIFALLEGLELSAARAAAARVTEADLCELGALVERMDSVGPRRWEADNVALHLSLFRIACMRRAASYFAHVAADWQRLRALRYRQKKAPDPRTAQAGHRAMLEALRARDATALERAIVHHNRTAAGHYGALP